MNIPVVLRDWLHPALHARQKVQIPRPSPCPRTGSNQGARGLQAQHHHEATSQKERAPPSTNSIYHKPLSKSVLWLGSGAGGTPARQADRHDLSGMQIDSYHVSPPFLPTAVNRPIYATEKYLWKLTLGSEGRTLSALCLNGYDKGFNIPGFTSSFFITDLPSKVLL